jgi:prepilin-type N-terminal cleavage/methylation domain-containing protein
MKNIFKNKGFTRILTLKPKSVCGFTLIELLVVISIISLLTSIVLSSLNDAKAKARDARRIQDLAQIRNAIELYSSDNGGVLPPGNDNANDIKYFAQILNTNYNKVETALAPKYIPSIPKDPLDPGTTPTGFNLDGYWYYYGRNFEIFNGVIQPTANRNDTKYLVCTNMEKNKKNYIVNTDSWAQYNVTLDYCTGSI